MISREILFARRRRGRRLVRLGAVASLALVAGLQSLPSGAAPSSQASNRELGFRVDGARPNSTSTTSNLVDHGGKILPASNTYALWWGTSSAWASDVQQGIGTMFDGLNGSPFLSIAAQYMRTALITSAYKGATADPSAPPKKMSTSALASELTHVYGTLDPSGVYFVYTSNFPRGGNFCAWHSYVTVNGQNIAVAYMPNTSGVTGCDPGNLYNLTGSEGLRSLANVTSHEFMEAITDASPGSSTYGWIDSSGSEIGDKCAWQFGGEVKLSNRSVWQLQEEWSNAITGCANG